MRLAPGAAALMWACAAWATDPPSKYKLVIADLESPNPAIRLAASQKLSAAKATATLEVLGALKPILAEVSQADRRTGAKPLALELMSVLAETLEADSDVVRTFRLNDSCKIVGGLVEFAKSEDRSTRSLSTMILARVVDNSTLPLVTKALQDETTGIFSRLNFLGILKIKANYALADNRDLIEKVVDGTSAKADESDASLSRENRAALKAIVHEIRSELKKSKDPDTARNKFKTDYCSSS
jgi:hypothetical protein